jgi:hypothetical protein
VWLKDQVLNPSAQRRPTFTPTSANVASPADSRMIKLDPARLGIRTAKK